MNKKYLVGQYVYDSSAKSLKESAEKLEKLVESHGKLLKEGKEIDRKFAKQLVNEAIIYERLIILEAAGADPRKMAEMLDGMLMTAEQLAGRLHAGTLFDSLAKYAPPSDQELDMADVDMWAKDIPKENKKAAQDMVKNLQKSVADVGVITKALMAIAGDIGATAGGEGGALSEIIKTLEAVKADKDAMLGQALDAYDRSVSVSKHPSITKRLGSLGKAFAKPSSGLKEKFRDAINSLVRAKAPGAMKLLNVNELVDAIMSVPVERVGRAFRAYDAAVSHYVDDEFLLKMAKPQGGIWGTLKGLADMFMSSGTAPGGRR